MYLNGQAVSTGEVTNTIPTSAQFITIGRSDVAVYSSPWAFHGILDDVRIYNRALSTSEVQQLYQYQSKTTALAGACTPYGALATAMLDNGFVVSATLTDGGCGYTNTPSVRVFGDGSGARAVAIVTNGVVTAINIMDAGNGYSTTAVVIAPPFIPQPTMSITALTYGPHVLPVIQVNLSNLSPYDNYQLEFTPATGGTWTNLGDPFTPPAATDIQYATGAGKIGFFRLKYVP